ncbi:MAG: NUDIX domain-containing protein [Gammaproteobacteria bacterium]
MGAGVIPFCRHGGDTLFLLSRAFSGRKAGFLNDFGGGSDPGETHRQTAVREFVEETETLFLEQDLSRAIRTPERVAHQIRVVEDLFERTLSAHPHWWCRRDPGSGHPPKDWVTFFIEMPWRDPRPLNRAWALDQGQRFSRRRELSWIAAGDLVALYRDAPERLWKRVRQLRGAPDLIREIARSGNNRPLP